MSYLYCLKFYGGVQLHEFERTKQEMANKTKARIIVEDKWERNKYLQECDSDTIGCD